MEFVNKNIKVTKIWLAVFWVFVSFSLYGTCGFTVSSSTVCGGDVVTIKLDKPYATFHKILVLRQNLQQATPGTDYVILPPFVNTDNEIKISFKGFPIDRTFNIALTENPNFDIPCNNKIVPIKVNSSPDPALLEDGGFSRCTQGNPKKETLTFTNGNTTQTNITQYKIDWGDGSAPFVSNNFSSSVTHEYNPGSYTLTYTVSGTGYSCASATKEYNILIGKGPRILPDLTGEVPCAPTDYSLPFDVANMKASNSENTIYKLYVNRELMSTYSNDDLPLNYKYKFEEGSCGSNTDCPNPNYFSIMMVATNECAFTQFQQCIIVKDSVKPEIKGKDTVCVDDNTVFTNIDPKSKHFVGDKCNQVSEHTWTVTPMTGVKPNADLGHMVRKNNIGLTFTQPGNYRINLHVKEDCNERDTFFDVVVVEAAKLSATFTPPPCIPENIGYVDVAFTSQVVQGVPNGYEWNVVGGDGTATFVNGTNANSKDVVIRFVKAANYNVSLSSKSRCLAPAWTSPAIIIKAKPTIDTNTIPEICTIPNKFNNLNKILDPDDDYFIFNNGNDNNATFAWTFDHGTPSSSNQQDPGNINYTDAGSFDITVTLSNECGSATETQKITLYNNPVPTLGPNFEICISEPPLKLDDPSIPGGEWSGSGIVDSLQGIFDPSVAGGGKQTITYTINQGSQCPISTTMEIDVIEVAGFNAGPNQQVCKGSILQLQADPLFTGGNWSGVGVASSVLGTFDPTGLVPGNYTVTYTYTDQTGKCTVTATKDVLVKDSIHFIPPPDLCINAPFNFANVTDNISFPAEWNFGDGSPISFLVAPSHTYTTSGIKNVTLKATTLDGCQANLAFPITVKENPPLSFNVNPKSSCSGEVLVSFPATHQLTDNYNWNYNYQNITKTDSNSFIINFPQPLLGDSIYEINLTANYYCGPVLAKNTVEVKSDPKAGFNIQSIGCEPFNPVLVNTAYGSATTYFWDFGIGGQTSVLPNPTPPTYYNPNRSDTTYTIKQVVSNTCGTDEIEKIITVRANTTFATIVQDVKEGCAPLNVQFQSISSDGSLNWDFGDGTAGFSAFQPKTYTQPGTYQVTLNVQGSCGNDQATTQVIVHPQPSVDFVAKDMCLGKPTRFIPTLTNAVSTTWDFGDGGFSTVTSPTHTYHDIGGYEVKLVAFSNKGCRDSITKSIGINNQPKVDFAVDNPKVCLGTPVTFINNTTSDGNPDFFWNFGDATSENATQPNPHNYANAGNYTVTLLAVEGECRDSVRRPNAVSVYPLPIAEFSYVIDDVNKFRAPVQFTNLSSMATTYLWLFNGKDSSDQKNPSFLFNNVGPNRVILQVQSNFGCIDTVIKLLAVGFDGAVYAPNVFAPELGSGESTLFKPKGVDLKEYHVQVFSTYGQLLWESTKLENGQPVEAWDGRYKGELMPQDTYVWKIRAIFKSGKAWEGMEDPRTGRKTTMGSVILLR